MTENLHRSGYSSFDNHILVTAFNKLESPSAEELSAQAISDTNDSQYSPEVCSNWLSAEIKPKTKYPSLAQEIIQNRFALLDGMR